MAGINDELLGGAGGPGLAGFYAGQEEARNRAAKEADIMRLMEAVRAQQQQQDIARQKLPGELERQTLENAAKRTANQEAAMTLEGIVKAGGSDYVADQKKAGLDTTKANLATVNRALTDKQKEDFADEFGQAARMAKVTGQPIDIVSMLKRHGMEKSGMAAFLASMPPEQLAENAEKLAEGMSSGSMKAREAKQAREDAAAKAEAVAKEQTNRAIKVAQINAESRITSAKSRVAGMKNANYQNEVVNILREADAIKRDGTIDAEAKAQRLTELAQKAEMLQQADLAARAASAATTQEGNQRTLDTIRGTPRPTPTPAPTAREVILPPQGAPAPAAKPKEATNPETGEVMIWDSQRKAWVPKGN